MGFQVMLPLDEEQYGALRASIEQHGVLQAIEVDEDGTIIDGYHRSMIAKELDIKCPKRVVKGLSEKEKRDRALMLNVARRQMSREQRKSLVIQLYKEEGMKQRSISSATGIPQSTVSDDLKVITESGKNDRRGRKRKEDWKADETTDSESDGYSAEEDADPDEDESEQESTDPFADWSENELDLRQAVIHGETVVASLRDNHAHLIRWAQEEKLLVRVDRRSIWGNPFEMPADGDRNTVIRNYANHYLPYKPSLLAKLSDLRGKVLACWCAPEPCHGDVLKRESER